MEPRWKSEVTVVPLMRLITCGVLSFSLACTTHTLPNDFRPATIDPQVAASRADVIVLAYPVDQRIIRDFTAADEQHRRKVHISEVETRLRVVHLIKGLGGRSDVQFDHYQEQAPVLIGPPQGPSGGIGARGIFFLRRQSGPVFRSLVDVSRPDIRTPWVRDSVVLPACASPAECIAELLMALSPGDNEESFAASLRDNMAIVRELVGYTRTLGLVEQLLRSSPPAPIPLQGCIVMSEWFPLELTRACISVISGTPAGRAYTDRLHRNEMELRQKGLSWLEGRVHPNDDEEFLAYLESLSDSADESAAAFAVRWARAFRQNRTEPRTAKQ